MKNIRFEIWWKLCTYVSTKSKWNAWLGQVNYAIFSTILNSCPVKSQIMCHFLQIMSLSQAKFWAILNVNSVWIGFTKKSGDKLYFDTKYKEYSHLNSIFKHQNWFFKLLSFYIYFLIFIEYFTPRKHWKLTKVEKFNHFLLISLKVMWFLRDFRWFQEIIHYYALSLK